MRNLSLFKRKILNVWEVLICVSVPADSSPDWLVLLFLNWSALLERPPPYFLLWTIIWIKLDHFGPAGVFNAFFTILGNPVAPFSVTSVHFPEKMCNFWVCIHNQLIPGGIMKALWIDYSFNDSPSLNLMLINLVPSSGTSWQHRIFVSIFILFLNQIICVLCGFLINSFCLFFLKKTKKTKLHYML